MEGVELITAKNWSNARRADLHLLEQKREYGEDEFNIWLVRTTPFGEIMWNTTHGDENEYGLDNSLIQTSSGGFALTGLEDSYAGYYNVLFLVTGPNGELLIDARFGGFFAEVGHSIGECQDAGFVIVGELFNFAYVYRVLLIRILGPQDVIPLGNRWLGLALLLPIVVSAVIVVLTIWLLRSKSLASEKT